MNTPPKQLWLLRQMHRYVAFAERRTGWLLLGFAALAVASLLCALRLELHTDMAEFLPDNHPGVAALRQVSNRQKSSANLVLLIESPDKQANHRFAEALRVGFSNMLGPVYSEVQWHPDSEFPEFAKKWWWLYISKEDLTTAEGLLDRLIALRTSPLLVDLEDDPEQELEHLRTRIESKLPPRDNRSHFEVEDNKTGLHHLGIMLWRQGGGLGSNADSQMMEATEALVQRTRPQSFHPRMRVEYTGRIGRSLDENRSVRNDLTLATSICIILVLLAIYAYFRRIVLLAVIGAPAVLGVFVALAVAFFKIHFLNANTAFLISIILGNGINTPIILLARYGEERRQGSGVPDSLSVAMATTLISTAVATTAASISYGCLLLTTLRGFNQFGIVGGAGALLVWVFTFLLVPPMVIFGERRRSGMLTPAASSWRGPFLFFGRVVAGHPVAVGLLTGGLIIGSFASAYRYARDPIEYKFKNLRSTDLDIERRWDLMYRLGMGNVGGGHTGTDAVILVDRPEQADPVATALWQQELARGDKRVLRAVRTIHTILPQESDQKLEILGRIRQKIDRHRELMSKDDWKQVQSFRPPDYLRKLDLPDLPLRLREAFTEVDGTVGRFIGIDADERIDQHDGRELLKLSRSLQVNALGKTWVAAAPSTVFAGMVETIISDGPRVTLAALLGVTLLLLIAFGRRGGPLVLASLGISLLWLTGLLGLLQLKLNVVNFVALSITLGVGAEYASNIWSRASNEQIDDDPARLAAVIADTGSAVALCSITTIIGYSSLLLAHNRALQSFGKIADLGEMTCLLGALVALPLLIRITRPFATTDR